MSPTAIKPMRGFTLIEMMIAVTLSLVVALVITKIYLSGLSSQQAQSDQGQVQESSRSAFDLLARSIKKAGYKNPTTMVPGSNFCNTTNLRLRAANDPAGLKPSTADLSGTDVTIANSSDILRVRYYGETASLPAFTADGTITDCLGNSVAANTLVEDTLFVAADANNDNEPTLFCYTSNATASGNVALVAGIESMQLMFGDDSNADGTVERYVNATGVSNFNNVRSVMISLVTRTKGTSSAVNKTARTIDHFGSAYTTAAGSVTGSAFTTPTDGRIRQHVNMTIALRNLCPF